MGTERRSWKENTGEEKGENVKGRRKVSGRGEQKG